MQLHYLSYGPRLESGRSHDPSRAEDAPVLLLHGLFGSADNWQTVSKWLAADFHVFAIDLRNHGRSPHVPEMNLPALARDVIDFMDAQAIPASRLLGHSLGAKVAMELALSAPERAQALIVVDMAPRAYPPGHGEILQGLASINLSEVRDRQHADALLSASVPELRVRQFLLKSLARNANGSFAWKFNLSALVDQYPRLNEAVPAAGAFNGPALFVRGQNSNYLLASDWPEILRRFPAARQVIIPGAGHWVHADAPDQFVRIILEFLKKN